MADGYYEWKKEGSRKQPYLIHPKNEQPFAMAGLWESWSGSTPRDDAAGQTPDSPIESCTIITTQAGDLTSQIHDRMPVILNQADWEMWLDTEDVGKESQHLQNLLRPLEDKDWVASAVSTQVNSPRNDDPQCVEVQNELF